MTFTITPTDIDEVIAYYQALGEDVWGLDWLDLETGELFALPQDVIDTFRNRCECGAIAARLRDWPIKCPVCNAMGLGALDPILWEARCLACPLGHMCWVGGELSNYNVLVYSFDEGLPVEVFCALADIVNDLEDFRSRMNEQPIAVEA